MPRGLPKAVKKCLEKSRDSALLAVETYNKPAVKFKSGGYIVLMVISWTSLFHAVFFKMELILWLLFGVFFLLGSIFIFTFDSFKKTKLKSL